MDKDGNYSFKKIMNILNYSILVIVATSTILILADYIRMNIPRHKEKANYQECLYEETQSNTGAGSCEKTVNVCLKNNTANLSALTQPTYKKLKKTKNYTSLIHSKKKTKKVSIQNQDVDKVLSGFSEVREKYRETTVYKSVFTKVYRFNQEEKYDYQTCNNCSRPLYFSRFGAVMANESTSISSGADDNYKTFLATTENNNISSIKDKIFNVNILTREPQNTQIRWLVSFDGKASWKRWDGQNWVLADAILDLKNIDFSLVGNTSYEISKGLKNYTLKNGENSLDFAAELFSLDNFSTPLVSKLEVSYY